MISSIREYATLGLVGFLFLSNTTLLSNLTIFIIYISIVVFSYKSISWNFIYLKLPLLCAIIISVIININKAIVSSENIRLITLASLFMFFPLRISFNSSVLFKFLTCIGTILLLIQIGTAFGFSFTNKILTDYYPIEDNKWLESSMHNLGELNNDGYFRRFGGIYYNPNIMGQAIVLWVILMLNLLDMYLFPPHIRKSYKIYFILLTFVSIIFSGSRTALAVFLIFLAWWNYELFKKYLIYIIGLLVIILLYFQNQILQFRIFSFQNGITSANGSGNIKLRIFENWIDHRFLDDFYYVWFGDLDNGTMFDADPGYLLNYFGLIGFIFILWYLSALFIDYPYKFKSNFSILLIGLGATIIFNFRFSILAFIIISIPYNHSLKPNKHENTVDRAYHQP